MAFIIIDLEFNNLSGIHKCIPVSYTHLSFQIGMVLAIVRDCIVKKVKKVGNKENS